MVSALIRGVFGLINLIAISNKMKSKAIFIRAFVNGVAFALLWAVSLTANTPFAHAAVHCKSVDRDVSAVAMIIPAHASSRVVVARDAVPVFSAPNAVCKSKTPDLPPRAKVHAHLEYAGFTSMIYIDPDGKETLGWVQTIHLRADGTGVGPKR
jgi:hypothetical protein